MNNIQHIIPNWNIMIQNDRTTVCTTNTLNMHIDLKLMFKHNYIINLTMMFHIDGQYLCPTTKECIYMQKAILLQITKNKRFVFKQNIAIMPY